MSLKEIENQRARDIKKINEYYIKKKKTFKKQSKSLENFSFDIVTDILITNNGIRYCKRKAIFIHQLDKYFIVKPR